MKISRVDARDFLSFGDLRLLVRPDLTVVTGPNGAGKSNLGQAVDVVCTLLGSYTGVPDNGRLGLFAQAGRFGSERFEIALGIELDQPWERDLVVAFLRTAYICSPPTGRSTSRTREDTAVRLFDAQSAAFLYSGTLRVRYDARRSAPWSAVWECGEDGAAWCVGLVGPQQGQLFPGTVDGQKPVKQHLSLFAGFEEFESLESTEPDAHKAGSDRDEVPAIPAGADQPRDPVDLRARLISLECSVTLGVGPAQAGNEPRPAPVLALARALHIDKPDQATYDFTAVMATILRKGILLTNNRRLPLARRFPSDRLHEPQDLRDGSAVAAELFRLSGPFRKSFGG
ncbi:hypothetical protein ABZW30_45870 [Kitasatospora sp. NPDC004669]|uniref:hypothetical protein n=1 Tax=Kitasatospora sp. NPDC004669 TaxID=3154555 RepID=UPI0033B15670